MNTTKSLLTLWAIITTSMIFIYIWHQNNLIKIAYKQQTIEQEISNIKKEIIGCKNQIAQRTTPEKILQKARKQGLIKTPAKNIKAIAKKRKEENETANRR